MMALDPLRPRTVIARMAEAPMEEEATLGAAMMAAASTSTFRKRVTRKGKSGHGVISVTFLVPSTVYMNHAFSQNRLSTPISSRLCVTLLL